MVMFPVAVLLVSMATYSGACQCDVSKFDYLDEYCKYDVAILGKAVSARVEDGEEDSFFGRSQVIVYTFHVDQQWKPFGENNGRDVEVRTPRTGMSCDTSLNMNDKVFLMANTDEEGRIWFYLCDPKAYWRFPSTNRNLYTDTIPRHCGFVNAV